MKKISIKTTDLISGIIITGIFIFLSFSTFSPFESIERVIYGIELRFSLAPGFGENRIAIVDIDDKSIKNLGPWPWPRSLIAEMIEILDNNGARIIGLDLMFNEKEQNQGLSEVIDFRNLLIKKNEKYSSDNWLLGQFSEIEKRLDNDKLLVQIVQGSHNVILPLIGRFGNFDNELVLTQDSVLRPHTIQSVGFPSRQKDLVKADELITPFNELARSCIGMGHINLSPDKEMEGRNHLLFFNFRGHIIPSMPLVMAMKYLDKTYDKDIFSESGVQLSNHFIPVSKGEFLVKFRGGTRSFPYYSFVDILNVKKVPAVFNDKIVLIGYTSKGGSTVNTPVDQNMPSVEYTANVLDNLLWGGHLYRPKYMTFLESLIIIFLVMGYSVALSRSKFINRTGITIALLFFMLIVGIISFVALDTWFKTVYICLALILIYFAFSIRDIILSQRALGLQSKESFESNRMLGLSFQSQGLLDLAYEKFRKCPLDDTMKDVIYNLGLDYERKRMLNKAISVYEYIAEKDHQFRDLKGRISKLKGMIGALPDSTGGRKEEKIIVADDLEVKPTVGRYEIIREIGQGAMGIVYLARDPKINRDVAIKTIRFSDEFEEERVKDIKARFFAEAEIAGKLSHPSIVSIYDAGDDFDLTYLAMEYLIGKDLSEYSNKGSLLPLRKVLFIVSETAIALDYAHKHNVIHRDVKPGNIMLLKDNSIKVTDFGIAKAMSSSQTKSGVVLGTPNYMSPEQINGQEIDGRSDVFALGVVLFELLTGTVPFHGKNLTNLLYQITQERHPSPREINPKIPRACEQIIDRALEKDPAKRFKTAAEMAKYLKVIIQKIDQVAPRRNK